MKKIYKSNPFNRYKIVYLLIGFIIIFILSCIFLREILPWEKLSQISNFFLSIGLLLTAFQLLLQEKTNKKEQISLTINISEEILNHFNMIEKWNDSDTESENAIENQINDIKKSMVFINRIFFLVDEKYIDFKILNSLTEQSLSKLIGMLAKKISNIYGTEKGYKFGLTQNFLGQYCPNLIKLYQQQKNIDNNTAIFENEIEKLTKLDLKTGIISQLYHDKKRKEYL